MSDPGAKGCPGTKKVFDKCVGVSISVHELCCAENRTLKVAQSCTLISDREPPSTKLEINNLKLPTTSELNSPFMAAVLVQLLCPSRNLGMLSKVAQGPIRLRHPSFLGGGPAGTQVPGPCPGEL